MLSYRDEDPLNPPLLMTGIWDRVTAVLDLAQGHGPMHGLSISAQFLIATVYPEVYPSDMPPLLAHLEPSHEYIRPH